MSRLAASRIYHRIAALSGPGGLRRLSLLGTGLILSAAFLALTTLSDGRTFIIEAVTRSAEITFLGDSNAWHLPGVQICAPRPVPDLRAVQAPGQACPAAFYSATEADNLTLSWRQGSRVLVAQRPGKAITITVQDGGTAELGPGTLLVITPEVWAEAGLLTARGHVRLGAPLASGATDFLVGGTWHAYQTGIGTRWLRELSEAVRSGALFRGASVMLQTPAGPAAVHVYLSALPEAEGFSAVMISGRGDVELSMLLFGASRPALIRTNWVDTVLASPVLLATVAALSFLSLVMQILLMTRTAMRRRRAPTGEDSEA